MSYLLNSVRWVVTRSARGTLQLLVATASLGVLGCGSSEPAAGDSGTGGLGGASASGGSAGLVGSGGASGVGGAAARGGSVGSGGTLAAGGSQSAGGSGLGGVLVGAGGSGAAGSGAGGSGAGGATTGSGGSTPQVGGAGVGGGSAGTGAAVGGATGSGTCVAGLKTADTCHPAEDTAPCVRSDRTCTCDAAAGLWLCVLDTGAGGTTGTGGATGSGGTIGSGGTGTGGLTATGGLSATGGLPDSGGAPGSGGKSSQDPVMHVFLLLGQSNMEGYAKAQSDDRVEDERVQVLGYDSCTSTGRQTDQWDVAAPPLHSCWNDAVGPGDSFGKTLAEKLPEGDTIALVPCAISGEKIETFMKAGGAKYSWIIDRAKLAQDAGGVIEGMIFHQGESNSGQSDWPNKVKTFVADLRTDLGLGNVPFLAGELAYDGGCAGHNTLINQLPGMLDGAYVVSAEGLLLDPADTQWHLHFGHDDTVKFGKRYAEKMIEALGW